MDTLEKKMDKLACEVCIKHLLAPNKLINKQYTLQQTNNINNVLFIRIHLQQVDLFRTKCLDLESKNASLVAQVKSLESQLAIGSTSSSLPDES